MIYKLTEEQQFGAPGKPSAIFWFDTRSDDWAIIDLNSISAITNLPR